MLRIVIVCGLFFVLGGDWGLTQDNDHPPPDDRFKTDILVVVAHPDDETMIGAWLATQILGHERRAAAIFATRGEEGGNAAWPEQHRALGAVREIEARTALAQLHVSNVWFLQGVDTPSQNVLRSLGRWPHGAVLEEMVRLIRLTRPETVVTWLPAPVPEQHGDHQAAGVLATEAFDMAGDPAWFGEQIIAASDPRNISNYTDGLEPWQSKEILYFSDGDLTGVTLEGPTFRPSGSPKSSGPSYARLAAEEQSIHRSQSETGQAAVAALSSGNLKAFEEPTRFFWGKSIGSHATPPPGVTLPAPKPGGLHVDFGGPWQFYSRFWAAHGLSHFKAGVPAGIAVHAGNDVLVPVLAGNETSSPEDVEFVIRQPAEWGPPPRNASCRVAAHSSCPVNLKLRTPATTGVFEIDVEATSRGRSIGKLPMQVHLDAGILPQ